MFWDYPSSSLVLVNEFSDTKKIRQENNHNNSIDKTHMIGIDKKKDNK